MGQHVRGTGRIFQRKRSPFWWAAYFHRGREIRESTHCLATEAQRPKAEKFLRERTRQAGTPTFKGPAEERVGFEDLAMLLEQDYRANERKSLARALLSIRHLRDFFGTDRAVDITGDRVTAYVSRRREAGAKPATIRLELAALKRMFRLAVKADKLSKRPEIPSIEVRNVRTGFFEEPDFRAVLALLPADLQPLMEFSYCTGWRSAESRSLMWRQIDFQAGTIRLEPGTTKNDEGRVFPFRALPALAELLSRQRAHTDRVARATGQVIPWVFHHRQGRPIRSYYGAWRRACVAAGLPGRLVHDFRRTAVRNLERAGVSRSVAMKLTGHKTESVYRRYAIVSEADLAAGVGRLAVLHESLAQATRTVIPIGTRAGNADTTRTREGSAG